MRTEGFAPIASYGAIGDGKSAALVARDGAIDWWAAPAMDSAPVFAGLLDPDTGGRFRLEPAVPYRVDRRYLPGTNVIETMFRTDDGCVRVIDSLNQAASGWLPWTELARDIQPVSGRVPMRWEISAGARFGTGRPWARLAEIPLLHAGDLLIGLVCEHAGELRPGLGSFSGEFVAAEGTSALLALVAAADAPIVLPSASEVRRRRDDTVSAWQAWSRDVPYSGQDRELVVRSVLALKLLTYAPTGAMAAAITSSLPERIGGDKNYDYRYGWVRDTSFVLDSFIHLGLTQEVQGTLAWMLRCIGQTAPVIHPFYGLGGHLAETEETRLRLRGYRDSYPSRGGNRAADQPQWGNYGDLLECVWLAVDRAGAYLDTASADLLASLGNKVCDIWTEPDCGIWELTQRRHNTFSKAGCWVALDRLVRLAERGQVSGRDASRWEAEKNAIREWISQHCWSEKRNSFVAHAGSDELDAALLLLARTGFVSGADERFRATVTAIRDELTDGPWVYRRSGARAEEGAFVACSFWLVDALVRSGQADEAGQLWRQQVARASDLGLFAEEIDPSSGAFLGNIPQGLSHLALINAAVQLRSSRSSAG
jgi:GH15 family glucan-1,4-alpha-glucosidase